MDIAKKRGVASTSAADDDSDDKLNDEPSAFLLQMRNCLSRVAVGEQVLARWRDDGWYCRGISPPFHFHFLLYGIFVV